MDPLPHKASRRILERIGSVDSFWESAMGKDLLFVAVEDPDFGDLVILVQASRTWCFAGRVCPNGNIKLSRSRFMTRVVFKSEPWGRALREFEKHRAVHEVLRA